MSIRLWAGMENGFLVYGKGSVSYVSSAKSAGIAEGDIILSVEGQALGYRKSLDEYQGMVLDFGTTGRHGIVMRDMKFPIDIVWVKKGVIVDIAKFIPVEQPTDGAWTPYFPREEANAVLELPAGDADKYGLKIGDKIVVGE